MSDSDNMTSDESLLFTSSDNLDSSSHEITNHGKVNHAVVGRGNATSTSDRRVVEVPQLTHMQVISPAVGGADQLTRQSRDSPRHAELEKVQAKQHVREIVRQATNAKTTLLKPPGENSSIICNVDPANNLKSAKSMIEPSVSLESDSMRDQIRDAFMIDQK